MEQIMPNKEIEFNEKSKVTIQRGKHNKENPYVMISKSMLRDKNLSARDKGVLCFLLSLPDTWVTHPRQVAETLGMSHCQFYSVLKELISNGYATKTEIKTKGRFSSVSYLFFENKIETPQVFKEKNTVYEKPYTEKPCTENPYTVFHTLENIDITDTNNSSKVQELEAESAKAAIAAEEISAHSLKDNPKKAKVPIDFSPTVKELAEKMANALHQANPHWLIPKNLHSFMKEIHEMITGQGRDPKVILDVFMWAVGDNFWMDKLCKPNPAKYLKDQFGQLAGKMNAKPAKTNEVDRRLRDKDGEVVDEYKDSMF